MWPACYASTCYRRSYLLQVSLGNLLGNLQSALLDSSLSDRGRRLETIARLPPRRLQCRQACPASALLEKLNSGRRVRVPSGVGAYVIPPEFSLEPLHLSNLV